MGKGRDPGKLLRAVLNSPQLPTSFSVFNTIIGSLVADVECSLSSMMQAAREAVTENDEDDPSHITACFDGSW
jgi:hypothetical protein